MQDNRNQGYDRRPRSEGHDGQQRRAQRLKDPNKPENVVYVGKGPTLNYALGIFEKLNSGMPEVIIKARGSSISNAVDVKEVLKSKFVPALKDRISTKTEELPNEDGSMAKLSAIEIVVSR